MIYRALVVGLGQIGMGYDLHLSKEYTLTHCRAFYQNENFELVGGVDTDSKKQEAFEVHYGVRAYDDIKVALLQTRPDVVAVAVPTPKHIDTICEIVREAKGVELIICEKPLGCDVAEAQEILDMCTRSGVSLFVNYMRYSVPAIHDELKRFFTVNADSGVLGRVLYTGDLKHSGSHFLQLIAAFNSNTTSCSIEKISNNIVVAKFDGVDVYFENVDELDTSQEQSLAAYEVDLIGRYSRLRLLRGGREIEVSSRSIDPVFGDKETFDISFITKENMNVFQAHVVDQVYAFLVSGDGRLCSGMDALEIHKNFDLLL